MKQTDFAILLNKYFTKYLPNERGSSSQTIDSYRIAFMLFLDYMNSKKNIKPEKMTIRDLTRDSTIGYINWLESERNCSPSTRNYRLSAIRSFVHFLKYEFPEYLDEYQKILGIPLKKADQKEISYMKTEGVRLLVSQIDLNSTNGLRDYVMLLILYTTGVRVSELINIKIKDISLAPPYTIKVNGKGNKSRYVPITNNTAKYIQKFLDVMHFDLYANNEEYIFQNHMKSKFTRQGINYVLKKYANKAKIVDSTLIPSDLTAHKMRHTTAMELVSSGVDLIYIRDLLGHSSVTTTEIYARTDSDFKRKAIEKASKTILPSEDAKWDSDYNLREWLKNFNK